MEREKRQSVFVLTWAQGENDAKGEVGKVAQI